VGRVSGGGVGVRVLASVPARQRRQGNRLVRIANHAEREAKRQLRAIGLLRLGFIRMQRMQRIIRIESFGEPPLMKGQLGRVGTLPKSSSPKQLIRLRSLWFSRGPHYIVGAKDPLLA